MFLSAASGLHQVCIWSGLQGAQVGDHIYHNNITWCRLQAPDLHVRVWFASTSPALVCSWMQQDSRLPGAQVGAVQVRGSALLNICYTYPSCTLSVSHLVEVARVQGVLSKST
jgi:hypothetical protein